MFDPHMSKGNFVTSASKSGQSTTGFSFRSWLARIVLQASW